MFHFEPDILRQPVTQIDEIPEVLFTSRRFSRSTRVCLFVCLFRVNESVTACVLYTIAASVSKRLDRRVVLFNLRYIKRLDVVVGGTHGLAYNGLQGHAHAHAHGRMVYYSLQEAAFCPRCV